ncbi:MAG: SMC-Scp complex subunit ScpB, partial [Pseudomonadota bacterium]
MTAPNDTTEMTDVAESGAFPHEEAGRLAHVHVLHAAEGDAPEADDSEDDTVAAVEEKPDANGEQSAVAVDLEHVRLIEALLFASADPVSERVLARRLPEGAKLRPVMEELERLYAGRGINLVRAGKTWAFRTAPDVGSRLKVEVEVSRKPSRAAVETLAIIAYHQPVTRAEIEEIRGVQISKGTLDWLFERGWIKPGPRREVPGRP